jgi:hypothetical protein
MFSRVEGLPHSRDGFNPLGLEKVLTLLPDHLHALPDCVGVLLSMLESQAEIAKDRQQGQKYLLFPSVCGLQFFLCHAAAIIAELGLQALQMIQVLLRLLALLRKLFFQLCVRQLCDT